MNGYQLSFGVLSDTLEEQLKRQGFSLNNAKKWEDIVACANRLYIEDMLTDSRHNEVIERIAKGLKKDVHILEEE